MSKNYITLKELNKFAKNFNISENAPIIVQRWHNDEPYYVFANYKDMTAAITKNSIENGECVCPTEVKKYFETLVIL